MSRGEGQDVLSVDEPRFVQNSSFFLQPVIFQVDNELFQLPDILFPASETFKDLYPNVLEGRSPVLLADCTKEQFEAFLTMILRPYKDMFPKDHPCNEKPQLDDVLPALELAMKWGFHQLSHDLRAQAECFLFPEADVAQKVAWGRRYQSLSWFRSGLENLVLSDVDISLEDGEKLGMAFALRVYHARSRLARALRGYEVFGGDQVAISESIVSRIVEDIFANELNAFAPSLSHESRVDGAQTDAGTSQEGVTPPSRMEDVTEDVDVPLSEGSALPATDAASDNMSDISDEYLEVISVSGETGEVSPDARDITTDAGNGNTEGTSLTTESDLSTESVPVRNRPSDKCLQMIAIATFDNTRRPLSDVLAGVPKVCKKMEKTCGPKKRCRQCCIKQAQKYSTLGWIPKARTTHGQMLMDHLIWHNSTPCDQPQVLKKLELTASGCKKLICGPKRRCAKCCRKEAKAMVQRGELF